jgi:hypothetical protein
MSQLSTAPSWQEFLLSNAANDLLMVIGSHRLYYDRLPIELHWLDRVSLLLIREAYQQGCSLALSYPVPVCNLPVLAAAELLVQDFVEHCPGKLSVLVLSPRIEIREQYLSLRIERETLASILQLARIRVDGDPAVIAPPGVRPSLQPRLYHLSHPNLLDSKWPKRIGVILVDHIDGVFDEEVSHIHELAASRKIPSVIHLCTDPFAPFLQKLDAARVPVWIWDHRGLASTFGEQITQSSSTIRPFGVSARQFQNIATGIKYHIVACHHPVFEAAAQRVWDDLGTIQRTFGEHAGTAVRRAIRAAYGTFYTMFQMTVPLPVYEEEARNLWGVRPVSRRIADLQAFESLLREEAQDLAEVYWPSMVLDLKEMASALTAGNPKYDTLVAQIREHQASGKELVVVCPNQATRQMLQLSLLAKEGLRIDKSALDTSREMVRLIRFRDLPDLESADTVIFPGQFSYARRQFILTAAAPEISFLAYEHEADRLEQQVAGFSQAVTRAASFEEHSRAWELLEGTSSKLPEINPANGDYRITFSRSDGLETRSDIVSVTGQPDLSLWTPFTTPVFDVDKGQDTLDAETEEALRPSEFAPSFRQDVMVPALKIEFSDGLCFAEPDTKLTVLLSATESVEERRTDALRIGDIVLLVNGDQRQSLYEAILKRVEHHPAMGTTFILVRYWQRAIREGFLRSRMTYDDFLKKLRSSGSSMRTAPGIRCWVVGEVLGPSDAEDIRRVGVFFDDQALMKEWQRIDRALRRIRGLHSSLARKLNRVIIKARLLGTHTDAGEECIDEELNLYVDDFRDSVTIHRITGMDPGDIRQTPYVFTGRLIRGGEEQPW